MILVFGSRFHQKPPPRTQGFVRMRYQGFCRKIERKPPCRETTYEYHRASSPYWLGGQSLWPVDLRPAHPGTSPTLMHSGTLTGLARRRASGAVCLPVATPPTPRRSLLLPRSWSRTGRWSCGSAGQRQRTRPAAEDAFQATFLVLASRARINPAQRVARRAGCTASRCGFRPCARARAARRQRHERRFAEMTTHTTEHESDHRVLSEEADSHAARRNRRLPKRFRTAVVLCYLEGQTHEKAAEQLDCPVGTIKSRLATAREKLRQRLTRRGVAPAVIPGVYQVRD